VGIRVRVHRGLGLLFVGRQGHIGVRARGEKVAGDLAGALRRRRTGKRERNTDTWGRAARERKGEERARGWEGGADMRARVATRGEEERR
jgi:hypothetical protein